MKLSCYFVTGIYLLLTLACTAGVSQDIGHSGLTWLGENLFLAVQDKKHPRDAGERVALLNISKEGITQVPVEVLWPAEEMPASDLEACCRVAGTEDEYLLAESGFYKGNFGRIFHVRLALSPLQEKARALVLEVIHPYPKTQEEMITPKEQQIEGMASLVTPQGDTIVVLGKRGSGSAPAKLVWGKIVDGGFSPWGEVSLTPSLGENYNRSCADLYLEKTSKGYQVWSVATLDVGDNGPFRSAIYLAGTLQMREEKLFFSQPQKALSPIVIEGLKVEGLAAPAKVTAKSRFSIATDDEVYGGVWRPVFAPATK